MGRESEFAFDKNKMEALTIAATVAGILGFIYVVFVGQKSIPEWFRERRTAKDESTDQRQSPPSISFPPRLVQHNLPHRGDFIGRDKEKRQVHEALKSRSFIITIDGIGGIGKTSLALEVLHECLRSKPKFSAGSKWRAKFEAFIWTSAKDRDLSINDMLDVIAHTLDYPFLAQLPLEENAAALSSAYREIVLANCR
jgi:hypothetical protein